MHSDALYELDKELRELNYLGKTSKQLQEDRKDNF